MADQDRNVPRSRLTGLAAVACLAAALAVGLLLPAAGTARTPAAAAPTRAAGSYCYYGTMIGYGTYTGVIPYFHAGAYLVPYITVTNVNVLGFVGDLQLNFFRNTFETYHVVLLPTRSQTYPIAPDRGVAVISTANGIAFSIQLDPTSDSTSLYYKVCV
ncbi:MAG TPA: hypothetical protein VMT59_07525 [Gaiellaceae bacterium]|nr:hypothetical protein [Gaiellaceae bacterium]